MTLRLVTPPASEPVSLDDAALEARVSSASEKARLDGYLSAARLSIESLTNRALITQTWELTLPGFRAVIELPKAPLYSLTSITYLDTANVSQVLAASAYVVTGAPVAAVAPATDPTVHPFAAPATIRPTFGTCWPSTYSAPEAVVIRFVAGYGTSAARVPKLLRQAVAMRAAQLYDGRPEDELLAQVLAPFRVWTFA